MDHATDHDQPFNPPTARQVRTHIMHHPARGPSKLVEWSPIIALAAAMAITLTLHGNAAVLLSWLIIIGVLAGLTSKARRTRRLEQRVAHIQEMAMLRHWSAAVRLAWRLLPSLITLPPLYGQTLVLIAHCLDQLKAYDAAIEAYDHLINHTASEEPLAVQLRIGQAQAQLATDQLTDADDALRKLRAQTDALAQPVIGAAYHLAGLIQQAHTGHWAEAVEQNASGLIGRLRPLGVEAGYGYALLALSYHQLDNTDPSASDHAARWWSRATLLLPVSALVDRFSELAAMAPYEPTAQPFTTPHTPGPST